MTAYLEFLAEPYNLAFLAAGVAAVVVHGVGRRTDGDTFPWVVALVALAVSGLTLNGAVHDLGLGDPAGRFPVVLVLSVVLTLPVTGAVTWLRNRYFPPVDAIRLHAPGLEGVEGRVISERVTEGPASGRAQWHDGEGVLHVFRCHTEEGSVGFGKKVAVVAHDEEEDSYLVKPK